LGTEEHYHVARYFAILPPKKLLPAKLQEAIALPDFAYVERSRCGSGAIALKIGDFCHQMSDWGIRL
jgi:hypothetical protein